MLTVDAKNAILSPFLVKECLLRCQREGRECTEIWISQHELKERHGNQVVTTLCGIPLRPHPEHDPDSLLFADSEGTILELHNLAIPILPDIFASEVKVCA
jgi:hypothetical protein